MESKLVRDIEKLQKQNKTLKDMLLETEKELDSVTQKSEEETSNIHSLLQSILPAINEANRRKDQSDKPIQAFQRSSNRVLIQMLMLQQIENSIMQVADSLSPNTPESAEKILKKCKSKIAALNSQLLNSNKRYEEAVSEKMN